MRRPGPGTGLLFLGSRCRRHRVGCGVAVWSGGGGGDGGDGGDGYDGGFEGGRRRRGRGNVVCERVLMARERESVGV